MNLFRKLKPTKLPKVYIPQTWAAKHAPPRIWARAFGWLLAWAMFVGVVGWVDHELNSPIIKCVQVKEKKP